MIREFQLKRLLKPSTSPFSSCVPLTSWYQESDLLNGPSLKVNAHVFTKQSASSATQVHGEQMLAAPAGFHILD